MSNGDLITYMVKNNLYVFEEDKTPQELLKRYGSQHANGSLLQDHPRWVYPLNLPPGLAFGTFDGSFNQSKMHGAGGCVIQDPTLHYVANNFVKCEASTTPLEMEFIGVCVLMEQFA